MRKLFRALGALTIFALGAGLTIPGAAIADPAGRANVGDDQQRLEPVPDVPPPNDFDCPASRARHRCRDRLNVYAKSLNKWAEVGNFNCSCRGSYKYPVPPQYTYFWPGMYSQQTMTEYSSPYRFPPLKLPPPEYLRPKADQNAGSTAQQDGFGVGHSGQVQPVRSKSPPAGPRAPESVSQKIKRHYCVE